MYHKEKAKKYFSINFIEDFLRHEFTQIYYGERIAEILFRKNGHVEESSDEKTHGKLLLKIIGEPERLDKKTRLFFTNILKSEKSKQYEFLKWIEDIAIVKYKILKDFIIKKNIIEAILKDELKHNEVLNNINYNIEEYPTLGKYEFTELYKKYKYDNWIDLINNNYYCKLQYENFYNNACI